MTQQAYRFYIQYNKINAHLLQLTKCMIMQPYGEHTIYIYNIVIIMNPLGVSVIFVICSILLSFLKHMLFPSSQSQSSITKFNKVFQLTDNKVESQSKYYKSLYEAYHRTEILDAEKYTSMLPNRSMFNQSVLRNSLLNEEVSFMCGSEYLVLVLSGLSAGSKGQGYTRWINIFEVYKLPLMIKIDEIKINGKTILPQQCKQTNNANEYQLSIISKIGPLRMLIHGQSAQMNRMSRSSQLNYYLQIDKFDYDGESIAYWSKQHPWVIRIQTNRVIKSSVYAQLPSHEHEQQHLHSHSGGPIQINLLNIEMQQSQSYDHTQLLSLRHIFLAHTPNNKIYLTVVYNYHNLGSKPRYIMMSSFQVDQDTMALLSRISLDIEFNCLDEIKSQCMRYLNDKSGVYDMSCVLLKSKGEIIKFLNVQDIYMLNTTKKGYGHTNDTTHQRAFKKNKQRYGQDYYEDGYADWLDDHLEDVYDQSDDDLLYMQSMTPLASNSYFEAQQQRQQQNKLGFIFKAPKMNKMKIIKPSLPDPIVYYADGDDHHMFTFNIPIKVIDEQQQQISLSTLFFSFGPPISQEVQEKALRDIKLIEKEHLIVVVWGGGIQVYEYQNLQFPDQNGQGIAMAVILPFVQLFATVFCLLRIVWNPE